MVTLVIPSVARQNDFLPSVPSNGFMSFIHPVVFALTLILGGLMGTPLTLLYVRGYTVMTADFATSCCCAIRTVWL